MIKLIASDMDGTLLNSKHKISEGNLEAIKKALDLGVEFAIVTGRGYASIENYPKDHGFRCEFILMNGAQYRDEDGNVLESIEIDKNKIKKVQEIMSESGLLLDIFTNKGRYMLDKENFDKNYMKKAKWFMKTDSDEEAEAFIKEMLYKDKITFISDINEIINDDELEIYKIITFDLSVDLISNTKEKLREIEGLSIVSTFSNDIEICHVDAQKGKILAKVIKKKGLSRDEVMVIGDSFNDYSMFEEFKNSYAMENAIPEIKEIAGFITDSNDNDGVGKAIYKALGI